MDKLDWILGLYLGLYAVVLFGRSRQMKRIARTERERIKWN